jgi:hypothetical protein
MAEIYDRTYAAMFRPSVLGPMTGVLAELARDGAALEFAVGTGRVALALSALLEPDHVGIETFDDLAGQAAWSHHWIAADGRLVRHSAPYRYVWPSELDLMARIASFRLRDRWAGWDRAPFTADSGSQVAVYQKRPSGACS